MEKSILTLEIMQQTEPASGVHLVVESIIEFATDYAKKCGYSINIKKEFPD